MNFNSYNDIQIERINSNLEKVISQSEDYGLSFEGIIALNKIENSATQILTHPIVHVKF